VRKFKRNTYYKSEFISHTNIVVTGKSVIDWAKVICECCVCPVRLVAWSGDGVGTEAGGWWDLSYCQVHTHAHTCTQKQISCFRGFDWCASTCRWVYWWPGCAHVCLCTCCGPRVDAYVESVQDTCLV